MQIVEPMSTHQPGMENMQQNSNGVMGLISSITTSLPTTIIQNGSQSESQQQQVNKGPDMIEQKSNNIVISKPSMYIENPSKSDVGIIQRPI
jgi:hypothetical protein